MLARPLSALGRHRRGRGMHRCRHGCVPENPTILRPAYAVLPRKSPFFFSETATTGHDRPTCQVGRPRGRAADSPGRRQTGPSGTEIRGRPGWDSPESDGEPTLCESVAGPRFPPGVLKKRPWPRRPCRWLGALAASDTEAGTGTLSGMPFKLVPESAAAGVDHRACLSHWQGHHPRPVYAGCSIYKGLSGTLSEAAVESPC
jgi:hypothetical protein